MNSAMEQTPPDMTDQLRIVLIDDVPDIRLFLREALEDAGAFSVVGEAGDGQAGLEVVQREQPDVVLLDLSMPIMDGLEALPLLREAAPNAKVVVYSGFEARRMGEQAKALGALAYIEKGVSAYRIVDDLLEVLKSADG